MFVTFFGWSARSQAAEPTKQDAADDNSADSKPADADNKESSDTQAKADKDSKTTHKVIAGPFRIDLKLEGIVEPRQMTEVILRTDQWTDLTVREAAAHGATVKKGDTILSLDLTKIRQEIKELETTLKLDEVALNLAKAEIEASEKSSPEDLAEAERAAKLADVDLKYFLETGRERLVRYGEFGVKMYSQTLENAEEELKQLEKMYKADDLTEGTEEIILKQQRFQVAMAAFMVEEAKVARDRLTQIDLPREETTLRESVLRKNLAMQRARGELPLHLGKLRLDFVKLKTEQQESKEKLAKLKHDEELMTVRSPADGIVLYGECEYGHWSHASDMAGKLRRGGSVTTHEVLMTIVAPSPLYVARDFARKGFVCSRRRPDRQFYADGLPRGALRGQNRKRAELGGPHRQIHGASQYRGRRLRRSGGPRDPWHGRRTEVQDVFQGRRLDGSHQGRPR